MSGLVLPFPPSVNSYWRSVRGRVLVSAAGRAYRVDVAQALLTQRYERFTAGERLAVTVIAMPPDKRRRDLDNLGKALLDALTFAGVYGDDSQIDRLTIERGLMTSGGRVTVWLEPAQARDGRACEAVRKHLEGL